MISVVIAEKIVAAAVMLCAVAVGYLTIHHGDVPLGLLVLLGQAQSLLVNRHSHSITDEATHLAIHRKM